jgi:exopolyphosphatase/guanosine-5'-triphosphate,3'-diphosphate pyrophosphatase
VTSPVAARPPIRPPVRKANGGETRPDRAVIDIGSNTVRLVAYSGSRRAPDVWLNEKVTARLGRDLVTTGRMPGKAMDLALSGLARYALILRDLEVSDVQCVATAAVRDASNGPQFLERVRALGLSPRLLSGEEEATYAALGVIGAFPGAQGVVADLGGGSLELVAIGDGQCREGVTTPLGTLRLGPMRANGNAAFRKAVAQELTAARWAKGVPGPLYLVGGTWRAFAIFAMHRDKYPLSDPHAYRLTADEALKVARRLAAISPQELVAIDGISASRAAGLPDAAAMLAVLVQKLAPESLVVSSWGLREGLLFDRLEDAERAQDPLIAAVSRFASPRGASLNGASMMAGWTAAVAGSAGPGSERLRLAATLLAKAQAHLEPNMRLRHSIDWALDKRWVGLDHRGRALIGAALRGAAGKPEPTPDLLRLASAEDLRTAAGWGLALRLCRRIGAGSRASMLSSRLTRNGGTVDLWLEQERAAIASDQVRAELENLARWQGCTPVMHIGERMPGEQLGEQSGEQHAADPAAAA